MNTLKNECIDCFYNNGEVCINHTKGIVDGETYPFDLYGMDISKIAFCIGGYRKNPPFLKPQEEE